MDQTDIELQFQTTVCGEISLMQEGIDRFRVFTPFRFEDGDHIVVVLKKEFRAWVLTDEGHTYMHLTYTMDEADLQRGTRQRIIANALSLFHVYDQDGELRIAVPEQQYGNALYSFIQAIIKISDVTFLTRERVLSTFVEDFTALLKETVPEDRRQFDWYDSVRDPDGKYRVNCRISDGNSPVLVYALQNDDQTRDANVSLLQFERWGLSSQSVAIFENQEEINRRVLARFSDVCHKLFSSLGGNRDRIVEHIRSVGHLEGSI